MGGINSPSTLRSPSVMQEPVQEGNISFEKDETSWRLSIRFTDASPQDAQELADTLQAFLDTNAKEEVGEFSLPDGTTKTKTVEELLLEPDLRFFVVKVDADEFSFWEVHFVSTQSPHADHRSLWDNLRRRLTQKHHNASIFLCGAGRFINKRSRSASALAEYPIRNSNEDIIRRQPTPTISIADQKLLCYPTSPSLRMSEIDCLA